MRFMQTAIPTIIACGNDDDRVDSDDDGHDGEQEGDVHLLER